MRLKSMIAMATAVLALGLASPRPAEAHGWHRAAEPAGWSRLRAIRHSVHGLRHHRVYHTDIAPDPYAYRYEPRGYYPYYNSGQWRPAREMRRSRPVYALPPYYKAWGYPNAKYRHHEWHSRHHGGHRHHRW